MSEVKFHKHPWAGAVAWGRGLQVGDTVETGDLFSSTSGEWEPAAGGYGPGTAVGEPHTIGVAWVRP